MWYYFIRFIYTSKNQGKCFVFESWQFFSALFQFDRKNQHFLGVEKEFQPKSSNLDSFSLHQLKMIFFFFLYFAAFISFEMGYHNEFALIVCDSLLSLLTHWNNKIQSCET